jgi:hypothetical protein
LRTQFIIVLLRSRTKKYRHAIKVALSSLLSSHLGRMLCLKLRRQGCLLSVLLFIFGPLHADLHCCAIAHQSLLLRRRAPIFILRQRAIIKYCRLMHVIIAAAVCISSYSVLRHGAHIFINAPLQAHLCCAITCSSLLMHHHALIAIVPLRAHHLCCAFVCSSSLLHLRVLIILFAPLRAQLLLRCCMLISLLLLLAVLLSAILMWV